MPVRLALLLALALSAPAVAAPLVTTAPGRVTTTFDPSDAPRSPELATPEGVSGLLGRPGGGLLATVDIGDDDEQDSGLLAYGPDGTLDRSFGDGGGVLVRGIEGFTSLVRRRDGRVLLHGSRALVRLDDRGAPDPAYGRDGRAELGELGTLSEVATTDDGAVLAGGGSPGDSAPVLAVARVLEDGRADPSFGDGGLARPVAGEGFTTGLAVAPRGGVVVAGQVGRSSVLVRLDRGGRLDRSFGGDGVIRVPFFAPQLEIDAGGRVLVGGTAQAQGSPAALRRYRADGRLDRSYGREGVAELAGGLRRFLSLDLRPDGSASAVLTSASEQRLGTIRLVRASSSGRRLDLGVATPPRFGGGLYCEPERVSPADGDFDASAVLHRPGGGVVVGGRVGVSDGRCEIRQGGRTYFDSALAAFDAGGRPLAGFGRRQDLRVRVSIGRASLGTVLRRGLRVQVRSERRGVGRAVARVGGRIVAAANVPLLDLGVRRVALRVSADGRRLLRGMRRAEVRLRVEANDLAGNRGTARARGTLTR